MPVIRFLSKPVRPAVELIDRLIKNSLVERRHNPTDRREVLIHLTNRADQILAKLSLPIATKFKKLAPLLIGLLARFDSQKASEENVELEACVVRVDAVWCN